MFLFQILLRDPTDAPASNPQEQKLIDDIKRAAGPLCTTEIAKAIISQTTTISRQAKITEVRRTLNTMLEQTSGKFLELSGGGVCSSYETAKTALSDSNLAAIIVQYPPEFAAMTRTWGCNTSIHLYYLSIEAKQCISSHPNDFTRMVLSAAGGPCPTRAFEGNETLTNLFLSHPKEIADITAAASYLSYWALEELSKPETAELFEAHKKEIVQIAKLAGPGASYAYACLQKGTFGELFRKNEKELIASLSKLSESSSQEFLSYAFSSLSLLSSELEKIRAQNPSETERIALSMLNDEEKFAGLCVAFAFGQIETVKDLQDFSQGKLKPAFDPTRLMSPFKESKGAYFLDLKHMLSLKKSLGTDALWTLHDEYNIAFFGRYTEKTLKTLYEQIGAKTELPLTLAFLTKTDWNGSFYMHANIYEHLSKETRLFIFEGGSDDELFAAVEKIGRQYGKIALIILGGHGDYASVNLGGHLHRPIPLLGESRYVDKSDMKEFSRLVVPHLTENSFLVFFSCSTGNDSFFLKSIARAISDSIPGLDVKAPDDVSQAKNVSVVLSEDKKMLLDVQVEYNKAKAKTFKLPKFKRADANQ